MPDDLDRLYALADGATAGPWRENEIEGFWSEDAAYIAALSPDVVKGLIERVKAAEAGNRKAARILNDSALHETTRIADAYDALILARTALEAKDDQ